MPIINAPFTSATSGGTGVAWANPANSLLEDGTPAGSTVSGASPNTAQLRLTALDLGELPDDAFIKSVTARVKAKEQADACELHRVFAWDGSSQVGDNQAATPFELNGTLTFYQAGSDNWSWWTLSRLNATANGITIEGRRTGGAAFNAISIDYAELEIDYACIPCPSNEYDDDEQLGVLDSSSIAGAAPLIAEKIRRVGRRRFDYRLQNARASEVADIETIYADGAGLTRPFLWEPPNESVATWWLFESHPLFDRRSAGVTHVSFTLVDATP